MPVVITNKGKKRAYAQGHATSSSLPPVESEARKVKKPKRAETRICPVCDELIPLRLLAKHSKLESERVEMIIKQVGSVELIYEDIQVDDSPGPSSRSRLSAVKARRTLSAMNSSGGNGSFQQAGKTIQAIIRRRKQRHVKFRDMAKEEEGSNLRTPSHDQETVCPVCTTSVRGDQDVIDAHVDACLAHENQRLERERQQAFEQGAIDGEVWEEGAYNNHGHVDDVGGTGFHTRDRNDEGVDVELDVDGDEGFGEVQFTEGDILPVSMGHLQVDQESEIDVGGNGENEAHRERHLRDLVAEGRAARNISIEGANGVEAMMKGMEAKDKTDLAILAARRRGDKSSLIIALENKLLQVETLHVSTQLLCRICIDSYNEPTTSTGCWHTFCRECWLRCLGSTKLCPICKRITGASDLRRIYL